MKLTFDHNCLIDLELAEGAYRDLRQITELHDKGVLSVFMSAIGASERMKNGVFADNFSAFRARVQDLSRREIELLRPLCYVGVTYVDWCVLAGDELISLEREIHRILFPETAFRWQDHAADAGVDPNVAVTQQHTEWLKWRNRKCDTLALWCHIHYGNDIFVTSDSDFHKASKKPLLVEQGAGEILYPSEVLSFIELEG